MNTLFSDFIEKVLHFFRDTFSDTMYETGLYGTTFWLTILFPLVTAAVYYYVVNHPRLNRGWHWLFLWVGNAILLFLTLFFLIRAQFETVLGGVSMTPSILEYSGILASLSFVAYFIFSFCMKWWSKNCRNVPF